MNIHTIHLESVEYGKNKNYLLFKCYMPSGGVLETFEYTGVDITGCVFEGYYLFEGLLECLQKDFGYAPFEIEKAKKIIPVQYQIKT